MNLNELFADLPTNDNEDRTSIVSESTSELYADVFEPVTKAVSLSTAERIAYMETARRNLKARKRRYAVCFIPGRTNEASLNQYNSQTTTSIMRTNVIRSRYGF